MKKEVFPDIEAIWQTQHEALEEICKDDVNDEQEEN